MERRQPKSSHEDKEGRQIARSAGLVGIFTFASRILGLIRDAVIAAYFHKDATDAFFVANTIPNVLRRLLGEGTLTVAVIPVFTEYLEQKGDRAARSFLSNILGVLLVVLTLVSIAGIGFAPWVVRAFAYGFTENAGKLALATMLTRVMIVFFLTTGLTALAMAVLNTCRHFAAPALSPVLLNAVIIGSILGGASLMTQLGFQPILSAGFGVVLGGVVQALLQIPFLAYYKMLVLPRFGFFDPGVLKVGKLMVPAIFGLAIYEINVIIARQLASFLPEGSISYLYYSQRLIEFPMGIFAVAIATVAMPNLSSHANSGQIDQLKATYRYSLRMVFFIILPATAGLLALALPLTSMLFQRGQFTHAMSQKTALTLLGFLGGLWAGAGVKQTVPVFYALQDTKTPVKAAAISLVAYIAAAVPLQRILQTFGLALAVATSSVINFLVLVFWLRVRLGRLGLSKVARSTVLSGVAALPCGLAAWQVARLGDWAQGGVKATSYVILVLAVGAGLLIYGVFARLLHIPELSELLDAFRKRGKKNQSTEKEE